MGSARKRFLSRDPALPPGTRVPIPLCLSVIDDFPVSGARFFSRFQFYDRPRVASLQASFTEYVKTRGPRKPGRRFLSMQMLAPNDDDLRPRRKILTIFLPSTFSSSSFFAIFVPRWLLVGFFLFSSPLLSIEGEGIRMQTRIVSLGDVRRFFLYLRRARGWSGNSSGVSRHGNEIAVWEKVIGKNRGWRVRISSETKEEDLRHPSLYRLRKIFPWNVVSFVYSFFYFYLHSSKRFISTFLEKRKRYDSLFSESSLSVTSRTNALLFRISTVAWKQMDYPRLVNCSNLDRVYQEARFSYAETVSSIVSIVIWEKGIRKKERQRRI